MRGTLALVATTIATLIPTIGAKAQSKAAAYYSQIDEQLTVRRVAVIPVGDNLDGIYARPIEAQLIALAKSDRQREFVEGAFEGVGGLADLEENPASLKRLVSAIEADAFIAASASKGPKGLTIKLDLFLKSDGRVIAQEQLKDHGKFDLGEVREQVKILYRKAFARLPYDGLVLSRHQNRVTVNLGRADGLTVGQTLTAIQVINANRHPKFGFIVSAEKEILGKIKVMKVDEGLSFGAVISERERGVIKRMAKISGLDSVEYPEPADLGAAAGSEGPTERADANVSFGKGAKEWLPVRPPAFGRVSLKLGLGQFNNNVNVTSVGNLEAKTSVFPALALHGEIWLTPNWQVNADILQGVLSASNPRSGSKPSELNQSMGRYSLSFGYNFLLRDDFFGPKLQVNAGFMNYKLYVDDSQPTALTTATYSGFVLGIGGSLPVSERKDWFVGGHANLVFFPTLAETPVSSGASSSNSINDFSLFVEKKIGENIRGIASIDFALYSTNFSGTGSRTGTGGVSEVATSMSQRTTTVNAGVAYLF